MQEQLDLLKLPKDVRGPVSDLVRALEATSTRADIESEGAMQLAFILSLEKAKRLKPANIEALYIIFDDAVQARLRDIES
ncbi:hypothetical protein YA0850_34410 [Pseudomonas veronii]|uniref:Uncharacterized protein n=1 Tax=Pseudomonas veronii TaxID=76761 RepID=A0A7Y1AD22_PSEVE|nr:hypothetical protein [Pseudomonas veronii]MBI6557422.1 hypothetical protein [Pseudomonas veronii]MBI6653519.1 hypothetical protein [Pseudomonas veronii]NMY13532.1 hypothetical protein [Pseudomonas veronii]